MRIESKFVSIDLKSKFVLVLCGFFVFSPIASKITMKVLGLPLALPELLLFPFYFYLKKFFDLSINSKVFKIGLLFITILDFISFIIGNFEILAILSTTRGYLYIVLLYAIFINKKLKDVLFILLIAIGSVFGWVFDSLLFVNDLANDTLSDDSALAVYGNMITLSLAISIPFIFNKKNYLFLSFVTGLMLSFSAGTRRIIVIFFISFVLSTLLSIRVSIKSIFNTFLIAFVAVYSLIIVYPVADKFINEISPVLYMRIFVKTEQFILGEENSSDQQREELFYHFIDTFDENLFPRGFVSKRTTLDKGSGIYMDTPVTELFYTFGIFGFFILFFTYLRQVVFHTRNYFLFGTKESAVCIVSAVTILVLLFIEGSFLNFVYTTPWTGYVLARIYSRKNLIND
jgi:hypothetical protein